MGPYSASKHAVSALAESLRAELHSAKVKVSVIEPGAIETEIWNKSVDYGNDLRANLPREALERYDKLLAHSEKIIATSAAHAPDADVVAQAVEKALTARFPKSRYVVGRDARLAATAVRILPDRLRTAMVRHI
jgi:short-subunit dehydrogenase